ncbi:MAG: ribonuclease P protein component [Limnothrix sp.]
MAIQKKHRLKHWRDFKTVYGKGKRIHGQFLVLVIYSDADQAAQKATQVGISVGRKVSKKAVVRNLIKRRLHHAFRELLPQIHSSLQIIIIVRSRAVQCEYEHFLRELKNLLIKAEVFDGH